MRLPRLNERDAEFVGRLAEQVAVTFGGAFVASLGATGGSLTGSALSAAGAAGLRAVYGYAVRWRGASPNDPNIK